jgi:hypothetical protein
LLKGGAAVSRVPDGLREGLVPLGGGGRAFLDPSTQWIWITTLVFRVDTFLRPLISPVPPAPEIPRVGPVAAVIADSD